MTTEQKAETNLKALITRVKNGEAEIIDALKLIEDMRNEIDQDLDQEALISWLSDSIKEKLT